MNDSKSYKVIIFGEEYTLTTNEVELHLLQSALSVDTLMRTIADQNKVRDSKRIAVLAALRLASIILKLEQELQKYKDDEKRLIDVINRELAADVTTPFLAQ